MDPTRFDSVVRSLSRPASRRGAFGLVVGALALLGDASPGLAKHRQRGKGSRPQQQASSNKGGNSACAKFCAAVFGADTPAAGQCTSEAAHGKGLCYDCGAQPATDVCCSRNGANLCPDYASARCCTGSTTCVTGTCQEPSTCLANNAACTSDTDTCCTTGYVCDESYCNLGGGNHCCGTTGAPCTSYCNCCGFFKICDSTGHCANV